MDSVAFFALRQIPSAMAAGHHCNLCGDEFQLLPGESSARIPMQMPDCGRAFHLGCLIATFQVQLRLPPYHCMCPACHIHGLINYRPLTIVHGRTSFLLKVMHIRHRGAAEFQIELLPADFDRNTPTRPQPLRGLPLPALVVSVNPRPVLSPAIAIARDGRLNPFIRTHAAQAAQAAEFAGASREAQLATANRAAQAAQAALIARANRAAQPARQPQPAPAPQPAPQRIIHLPHIPANAAPALQQAPQQHTQPTAVRPAPEQIAPAVPSMTPAELAAATAEKAESESESDSLFTELIEEIESSPIPAPASAPAPVQSQVQEEQPDQDMLEAAEALLMLSRQ